MSGAATAAFTYDGDGNRVKSVVGATTTLFVGSHYESSGGVVTKYYLAGGTRVAMRKGSTFYWLLSDHLGSTNKVVNANGTLHSWQLYKAWGEWRASSTPGLLTDYAFTGQKVVSGVGLYYYGARWYDTLSHFVQPDTLVPDPYNPLDWNRYSYARNNPVRYTDPTGHIACDGKNSSAVCSSSRWKFSKQDLIEAFEYEYGVDKSLTERINRDQLNDLYKKIPLIIAQSKKGAIEVANFSNRFIPGSAETWNNIAIGFDGFAWLTDLYAAGVVTAGGVWGAGIPAALLPAGIPEVPVVTGLGGMAIAELAVQPVLTGGNLLATGATFSSIIGDMKDGTTPISRSTINSILVTAVGWVSREAYLSLTLQSTACANDFGWISFPIPSQ